MMEVGMEEGLEEGMVGNEKLLFAYNIIIFGFFVFLLYIFFK